MVTYLILDEENDGEVRIELPLLVFEIQNYPKNGRGWPRPYGKVVKFPKVDQNVLCGS